MKDIYNNYRKYKSIKAIRIINLGNLLFYLLHSYDIFTRDRRLPNPIIEITFQFAT